MSGSDQLREDYRATFLKDEGARVLGDLFRRFHMGISTHVPGDPYETSFREGQRNVGLHVLELLGDRSDPTEINKILDQGTTDQFTVYMRDD